VARKGGLCGPVPEAAGLCCHPAHSQLSPVSIFNSSRDLSRGHIVHLAICYSTLQFSFHKSSTDIPLSGNNRLPIRVIYYSLPSVFLFDWKFVANHDHDWRNNHIGILWPFSILHRPPTRAHCFRHTSVHRLLSHSWEWPCR